MDMYNVCNMIFGSFHEADEMAKIPNAKVPYVSKIKDAVVRFYS
jgi:hypothetical protein